jgi:transmembrane sensor
MKPRNTAGAVSPQISEEATDWFLRFCEGEADDAAREEFIAWLRASPEHVRGYLRVSAFWEAAGLLKPKTASELQTLVDRAGVETNVVALNDVARLSDRAPDVSRPPKRKLRWAVAVAAVAACVLIGVGVVALWESTQSTLYATSIGEQRHLTLEDGSIVELNALSRMRVRFTPGERAIELLEGQAMFRVAKNASRPFTVRLDGTSVRAVGTQFDVYRKPTGAVVTVVEGKVAVRQNEAPEVLLAAGEQANVTPVKITPPRRANVDAAIGWTRQVLVFDSTALPDVVAEINRYNTRRLVLEDPQLDGVHVSGTFPASDPQLMVDFLRKRFDLEVRETPDAVHLSMR